MPNQDKNCLHYTYVHVEQHQYCNCLQEYVYMYFKGFFSCVLLGVLEYADLLHSE